jgi:hypothetical protein
VPEYRDEELAVMVRTTLDALQPRRLPDRFSCAPLGKSNRRKERLSFLGELGALLFDFPRRHEPRQVRWIAAAALAALALGLITLAARPGLGPAILSGFNTLRSSSTVHPSRAPYSSPPASHDRQPSEATGPGGHRPDTPGATGARTSGSSPGAGQAGSGAAGVAGAATVPQGVPSDTVSPPSVPLPVPSVPAVLPVSLPTLPPVVPAPGLPRVPVPTPGVH